MAEHTAKQKRLCHDCGVSSHVRKIITDPKFPEWVGEYTCKSCWQTSPGMTIEIPKGKRPWLMARKEYVYFDHEALPNQVFADGKKEG